jgi:hypothetical protein
MNFLKNKDDPDKLSQSMQDEIIKMAEGKLKKRLPDEIIAKVRQKKWSYMGLEMIMDTITNTNPEEIESYLAELD